MEPCVFCSEEEENIEHLFFSCPVVKEFWQDIMNWIKIKVGTISNFKLEQIIYGNDNLPKEICKICNILIIMGKYHIHKGKWQNKKPCIIVFKGEMKEYYSSLLCLKNSSETIHCLCEDIDKYLL